jgi:cytochrome c-type biogenesis protein
MTLLQTTSTHAVDKALICLPIVMAESLTAAVRRLIENRIWQGAGAYFHRGAGVIIGLLGVYFMVNPFIFL